MCVTHYDRRASAFVVEELEPFEGWSQGSFRVWLTASTYDCGLFQSLYFPCHHVVAACVAASVKWSLYVHSVYLQSAVFKVYETEFPLIPNEKLWLEWFETRLRPNLAMRRKATGKPVLTRFRNEMDEGERQEKRCGLCRQIGHTKDAVQTNLHTRLTRKLIYI
ncbi:hypothetical protein Ahy_B08g091374 [Arachis hypogaea]|uniref:SWIM-type domain-containing protein n=1 Tax=Arachis hypogaea TaxID=3818 RepID=A0A444Y265_ARAHY|nr:hypothetical protein Ahy_B08g091374 [Arachis hypogaea]